MADPNKGKTVLLGNEMYAYSSVFSMACAEESRAFANLMAVKLPLEQREAARVEIEKCTTKHFNKVQDKCGDEYKAACDCLAKNRREWSKCANLRTALEDCAVKKEVI